MNKNIKPFGIKDKIGYAFGDIGNNFTFTLVSSFLMLFYTNVWGIDPKVVGGLFFVSRLVDAFTDVGMGTIVDRFAGNKDGKFRPFMKWGAVPVAVAGFLLFQTGFKDFDYGMKVIIMYATYILWGSLCYTFINIPYGSMASAITPEADQRTELSTFRTLGATIAMLVIGTLTPYLLYQKVPGQADVLLEERFPVVAGLYGLMAIASYLLCYKLVTERVDIARESGGEKESIISGIGNVLNKRSLLSIILVSICLLLGMLLIGSMNAYVYGTYFGNSTGMQLAGLVTTLPMLVTAPTAMKLGQKIGKKEATIIGLFGSGAIYFILYVLKVKNMYVFLAGAGIAYVFLGIFNTLTWAMITDVIDDLEIKNGVRDDGKVYAIYSFARKLGQAFAGGLGGFALSAVGFVKGAATQTPEVALGIYNIATLIPAIALPLGGIVVLFLYPLSKKQVEENNKYLEDKRELK
ncbi:glycoside-pentoside-hexuronide (GPH):cation symporter [Anaerococcus sp. NML200537]|uniref:MFS transporter n=1 Tax=Anaerococcus sp. NML200537 TaxID=2954485 RepID=UPI0022382E00|nr:glycoside-pentoside-hexuronide (GPH):cation symporter [Anaerococcus sp. NML200537]MCW6702416.1 glycoside-pentoside-hexuronide (GPH):cation symporter [Anaerococcus sp. NML200537]